MTDSNNGCTTLLGKPLNIPSNRTVSGLLEFSARFARDGAIMGVGYAVTTATPKAATMKI
jgi:hypothetical protein